MSTAESSPPSEDPVDDTTGSDSPSSDQEQHEEDIGGGLIMGSQLSTGILAHDTIQASNKTITAWKDGLIRECSAISVAIAVNSIQPPVVYDYRITARIFISCDEDPLGLLSPEFVLTEKTKLSDIFESYYARTYRDRNTLPAGAETLMTIDRTLKTLGPAYSFSYAVVSGITVEDTDWIMSAFQRRQSRLWLVSGDRIPGHRYTSLPALEHLSL